MTPLAIIPAAVFSFLGGACLGRSRRGLSMLPPERGSPLPGVSRGSWTRFVEVMIVAPRASRERGRLGYFGLGPRHLADVGFMSNPRKALVDGVAGTWTGDWEPPLSGEVFAGSAPVQYEAFCRTMRRLAPRVSGHVGRVIDDRRASLSGLLAAGVMAGEAGVASFVSDPSTRRRFAATTARFKRANGIF